MARIERFEDLESWRFGRQLRGIVYRFTRLSAFAADNALVWQIRRAAVSVTANIAGGFERGGNREFIQFLSYAKGSVGETKDHLYTALDEGYIGQRQVDDACALADQTTRLIGGLMRYLRSTEKVGAKFVSKSTPNPEP